MIFTFYISDDCDLCNGNIASWFISHNQNWPHSRSSKPTRHNFSHLVIGRICEVSRPYMSVMCELVEIKFWGFSRMNGLFSCHNRSAFFCSGYTTIKWPALYQHASLGVLSWIVNTFLKINMLSMELSLYKGLYVHGQDCLKVIPHNRDNLIKFNNREDKHQTSDC